MKIMKNILRNNKKTIAYLLGGFALTMPTFVSTIYLTTINRPEASIIYFITSAISIWSFLTSVKWLLDDKVENKPAIRKIQRRKKQNYYLDIAEVVLTRGTCVRRNFGAVLIKNDEIISTGYTGAPRGRKNCCDIGTCKREEQNIPRGTHYELCRSQHAESNCCLSARRQDMIGATLYLVGKEVATGEYVKNASPCMMCKRELINAGIEKVIIRDTDNDYRIIYVSNWINDDDSLGDKKGY